MAVDQRPLSPHLQVYRPQITSVLSIMHRFTGVALSIGALFLVMWLVALASGPEAYTLVLETLLSPVGLILLAGWTYSIFYHLCNGIRHLFWDAGKGFEMRTARASGWAVVIVSATLTVAAMIVASGMLGGSA